jgi:hypothetical protein
MRNFAPAAMIAPGKKELGGTAWLDLANATARDYCLCIDSASMIPAARKLELCVRERPHSPRCLNAS